MRPPWPSTTSAISASCARRTTSATSSPRRDRNSVDPTRSVNNTDSVSSVGESPPPSSTVGSLPRSRRRGCNDAELTERVEVAVRGAEENRTEADCGRREDGGAGMELVHLRSITDAVRVALFRQHRR